jgi:hypothetical protein
MTIVERVAAAIAAGRTGTTARQDAFRADAERMIALYDDCIATLRGTPAQLPPEAP